MRLEVLPALKGDCLLLHCGTEEEPKLILIDGGPAGVYKKTLRPRLMAIREERGLDDDRALMIDLVVVSHVDDDHINGILALFRDIHSSQRALFDVSRLWHNSFDEILGNDETASLVRSSPFGAASTESEREVLLEGREPGPPEDAAFALASVKQGDQLRELALALDIPINPECGNGLIVTAQEAALILKAEGVAFTVIGPQRAELVKLQADHDAWLETTPKAQRDAESLLAALDDKSVANLSSIVLLAKQGERSILLTGDARSDFICRGLELCGALEEGGSLEVGILKMPHHGSIRNLDEDGDFLRRVTSRNYVFSGNGEHGNPDRETFDLLFKTRPGAGMNLYLTYTIEKIDPQRRAVFERERERKLARGKPAPEWSDADNALATLLSPPPPGATVIESDGAGIEIPQG